VSLSARDVESLNEAVAAVTGAFLGTERGTLQQKGILRVGLDNIGPGSTTGSGSNRREERPLTFNVLYEFLKKPEESEGTILEVPINLDAT
jgi:hypothetical protein